MSFVTIQPVVFGSRDGGLADDRYRRECSEHSRLCPDDGGVTPCCQ